MSESRWRQEQEFSLLGEALKTAIYEARECERL